MFSGLCVTGPAVNCCIPTWFSCRLLTPVGWCQEWSLWSRNHEGGASWMDQRPDRRDPESLLPLPPGGDRWKKTPSSPDAESACNLTFDVQSPELGEMQVCCSTAQSVAYYHNSPEGLRHAPSSRDTGHNVRLSERSTGPHPRRRKTGHSGRGTQVAPSAPGVVGTKPLPPCSHY